MRVTFWGVRGSVPWATAASIGVGCNTPCVAVRDERTGAQLVLDAGSGLVGLGQELAGGASGAVPVLLTHYHWDHTQGLPFFAPLYTRGLRTEIWAPRLGAIDAARVETMFQSPFYPVPYAHLPSRPVLRCWSGLEVDIGVFRIRAHRLRHPGGALAYRLRGAGGDFVYATDHELGDAVHDAAFAGFVRGARAVVLDAHFTPAELPAHRGWGHSSWRQCAEFALAGNIGELWLFHHKPGRTDAEMAGIEVEASAIFPNTRAAREGVSFEV
ncbi:MAG: MBL fold metallo-hydrolase [Acidobacteria bacterium]|nr:MBL fold metallo-hydrolase [Acidobacteriota bacterium]